MNPPSNLDAERAVLGAILLRPETIERVGLVADEFFHPLHRELFLAAQALWQSREPVDILTLADRVPRAKPEELADLAGKVPTAESAGFYARLVREASARRRVIAACHTISERAQAGDIGSAEVIRDAVDALEACHAPAADLLGMDTVLEGVWGEVTARRSGAVSLDGVPTGLPLLDERLEAHGLKRGQVTIAAGATSAGKSALALTAMLAAARAGLGVLCASIEDDPASVAKRALARMARVDNRQMQRAVVGAGSETERLTEAISELASRRLFFFDRIPSRIDELTASIERHVRLRAIDLVVIDFLQLLASGEKHAKRQDEVDAVFGSIVRTARRLPCATLVVSQLRRTEGRPPTKEDLYHSGALEQWAHTILLLWRPELRKHPNLISLLVAKQKNGPCGRISLGWESTFCCYRDALPSEADAFERDLDGAK